MKPYIFFCNIPGHEQRVDCDTFEEAFRFQYMFTPELIDANIPWEHMDMGMGIIENGTTILAPDVNKRAVDSGLMDTVLMEESGDVLAEIDALVANVMAEQVAPFLGEMVHS